MNEEQSIEVTIATRVAHEPWWAPLGRAAERVVRVLPTHRETKSGRRNATQVRVGLLLLGLIAIVFWKSTLAPVGFIPCVLALFVPLSETRRRTVGARLRSARLGNTRVQRQKGRFVATAKHLEVRAGEKRLRRLRRQGLEVLEIDDRIELREGKKATEQLVVTRPQAEPDLELWIELEDPSALPI